MIYRFGQHEIDRARVEILRSGESVPVEPQVFQLVLLLVENRDRLVPREELVEKIWDGRAISESVIDSRIKSARRALGDDGRAQRVIRTVHGQGFRFVADVEEVAETRSRVVAHPSESRPPGGRADKPSIAVLPFRFAGTTAEHASVADALPDELIVELSRLRWLFVIARGSSFRFRSAAPDPSDVGRILGAGYCVSGVVEVSGSRLVVTVELTDTRTRGVVWADRLTSALADVHETRSQILARVVAALEMQIPLHEAEAARLLSPDDLDAWSAYHLGLRHMFRFNRTDNAAAAALFSRAVSRHAGFARAHAGLSFVHFQDAFLGYSADPQLAARAARAAAERSIELDPLDAFANLAMGRSYWLEGDLDAGLTWLARATELSPSYAHGIYARAWTHALSGRGAESRADADLAMALSPLDPLYYAMAATRALSHIASGETAEAAAWGEKAARSPGAHVLIGVIATAAHALHGDRERASAWAASVRERKPSLTAADFFRSFPFADPAVRARMSEALASAGI